MTKSNSKGFAAAIPVVIVFGLLLLSLIARPNGRQAVLPITDYQTTSPVYTTNPTSSSNSQTTQTAAPTATPTSTPSPTPTATPVSVTTSTETVVVQFSSEVPLVEVNESSSNSSSSTTSNSSSQNTGTTNSPFVPTNRTQPTSVVVSTTQNSGRFLLNNSVVNFSNNIPLSVNQSTNQFIVATSNGDTALNLSPDLAAQTLLNANILSTIVNDPATGRAQVNLILNEDGNPFYEFKGQKTVKLLGIFSVSVAKTIHVLASDGSQANVILSGFDRFINSLSF